MNEIYESVSRGLIMIRAEIHNKNYERVLERIGEIKELPGFSEEGLLFEVVMTALDETARLVMAGEHEQAYDLTDAVHCLPDILASDRRDMKAYWRRHISVYQRKWRTKIFDRFKKEILRA